MPSKRPLWRAIEWERAWKLYESMSFTNGEKVVIGWMISNANYLDVRHAHQFIANGTRVSRSTVTRTMRKLVTMEAAAQVGEMHIQMRHPRRIDASSVTHNGKENVSLSDPASYRTQNGEENLDQKRRRIAAEHEQKYGKDWRDLIFCRLCLESRCDSGFTFVGDKWHEDLKRLLPLFECNDCKVAPPVAGSNGQSGDTGLRPGGSRSLRSGGEEGSEEIKDGS
jgi:hypothetical protein